MRALPFSMLLVAGCDLFAPRPEEEQPDSGDPRTDSGPELDSSAPDAARDSGSESRSCGTAIRYRGHPGQSVLVAGSWDGFQSQAPLEDPAGDGSFAAELDLEPGLYAYKFIVDGVWILDPSHRYRAYDEGIENSGLRVGDCRSPILELFDKDLDLAGASRGAAHFRLRYLDGADRAGADSSAFELELRNGRAARALKDSEWSWDADGRELDISLQGLSDGKHTLALTAQDLGGRASNTVLLPFWVEPEAFGWRDALIYMIVTDRFRNGDQGNDGDATPGAVSTADFHGGDLAGITRSIEDGTLEDLGVRALWLTPFNRNPEGMFADADGVHMVTGYHGYWPIDPRGVDPRLGGDAALVELTEVAHQHGIRVLMDFVINHVHEQHPYFRDHPEWFHTIDSACRCGTDGCDWTARRLDCLFHAYMPDIAWENNEASEAFLADALYWLEAFDLDGLRVDAVKHVPDGAIFNLGTRVRESFETAGTDYFLMGETAMGWYDCDPVQPDCNAENYGTISRYVGPDALDGQFDFVLFHGTALRTFAWDEYGMIHASVWTQASGYRYPEGAVMTPYVGSHDTSRFLSSVSHSWLVGNKWPEQELPAAPKGDEPYRRLGLGLTWNLTIQGAPLLYYGDEYGEFGASDPDNRHAMRFVDDRNERERDLYEWVAAVGRARRDLVALRRGELTNLEVTEDFWAYARHTAEQTVVIALNRSSEPTTTTVWAPGLLVAGAELQDVLGGATVTVGDGGDIELSLEPYRAAILAP